MEINLTAVAVSVAALLGALLFQTLEHRRAIRERDDALARVFGAEASACAARAETGRADAIAAKLWLYIEPSMTNVYQRGVEIYGPQRMNREMRDAVERGDWRMPERTN
jgi:hypothetical protein